MKQVHRFQYGSHQQSTFYSAKFINLSVREPFLNKDGIEARSLSCYFVDNGMGLFMKCFICMNAPHVFIHKKSYFGL